MFKILYLNYYMREQIKLFFKVYKWFVMRLPIRCVNFE